MLYVRYYMYALLVYILLGSLLSDRKIQTIRQVDGKRLGKEMTGTGRRAPRCSHPERPGAHLHSIKTARFCAGRPILGQILYKNVLWTIFWWRHEITKVWEYLWVATEEEDIRV